MTHQPRQPHAPHRYGLRLVNFFINRSSPRVRDRSARGTGGRPQRDIGRERGTAAQDDRGDRAEGETGRRDGPQGGETCASVGARADRVIELVRAVDGPVLAFSHGHFCRVLGARWLGLPVTAGAHLKLSTASVSVLGWERETPAVVHWNDTGRLD